MKKWIIPVITLIILVGGVAAGIFLVRQSTEFREKAAPATTLFFNSSSTNVEVGETFILSTITNSGENQIAGVQLAINYDSTILQVDSVTKGNFLGESATTTEPIILKGQQGLVDFSIFLPFSSTPVQGSGTAAIITFTAISEGTSTISFIDEVVYELGGQNRKAQTQAYGIDEINVIASTTPITITVSSKQTQPTTTPTTTSEQENGQELNYTPTPTSISTEIPTNTPSPTPTENSGTGGFILPTSTPTNTPTPTSALIAQNATTPTSTPTPAQLMDSGFENYTFNYLGIGLLAILLAGLLVLSVNKS